MNVAENACFPGSIADSCNILVLEHHPLVARYLRTYLEHRGHRVQSVADVRAAQQALAKSGVEVLITDVYLESETCFSLLDHCGTLPPLVVTMSGFDLDERLQYESLIRGWTHLVKPFEVEELNALLENYAVARRRAEHSRDAGYGAA